MFRIPLLTIASPLLRGRFVAVAIAACTCSLPGPAAESSLESAADAAGNAHAAIEGDAQSVEAAEHADLAAGGELREGMTKAQVLSLRGKPTRQEVIPPDAELWHYARGEIAFSEGVVTYIASALRMQEDDAPKVPASKTGGSADHDPQAGAARYLVRRTNDGFVAIRSEPTTASGYRVRKLHQDDSVTCERSIDGQRLWEGSEWLHCSDAGGWIYAPLLRRQ